MKIFPGLIVALLWLSTPVVCAQETEVATFAGGCFWCMEAPFDELPGVKSTVSGYMGGHKENPTYKEVSAGVTGHAEVIQITYDPTKISFEKLLEVFWKNIDPTVKDRQFCDWGSQYRSSIFFHSKEQQETAERSKKKIMATKSFAEPVVTPIVEASEFYKAEEYHQDFYKKNPAHYKSYRKGCGRDKRLKELWGK